MPTAIIIGGGPAGLTAAYELQQRTDIRPIVLELGDDVGGISRTIEYQGNRIDIGGHRFFSKSNRVMDWWLNLLPIQKTDEASQSITYQQKSTTIDAGEGPDPNEVDDVMLVRPRQSRIYYRRKFFNYPISLSANTIMNLGPVTMAKMGMSYMYSQMRPTQPETNLEHFLVNRFGRELYLTFFKDYTEKVWGVPCNEISAEWGAQRIKGLSVAKAIKSALAKPFRSSGDLRQKGVETSLIERFLYPKFGPGQMWRKCAAEVEAKGGEVLYRRRVESLRVEGDKIVELTARNLENDTLETYSGDYFFSTMPIQHLLRGLQTDVPSNVREASEGLVYRDFVTVGMLLNELKIRDPKTPDKKYPADTWLYIQEPDVHVGRLQIFNNWSPWMVADPKTVWIGLEYFCNQGDAIWNRSNDEMIKLGREELARIGIIDADQMLDATVIRVPKTYPAYFGTYDQFPLIRGWLDQFSNLFPLGRNGMHRYNNQDHSMLTAMTAVDNLVAGRNNKDNIWDVNTEQEYHEEQEDAKAEAKPESQSETKAEALTSV
ncbi:NAD(P)-binding protein [bacterium]|nr:NAD(P)-binding protein [bacterium]